MMTVHEIMGFVLPIVAASAEAMIWILLILILVIIGKGKILPSQNRLSIVRAGHYKMDLAPGLNLAQPFIEAIAEKLPLRELPWQDNLTICFEVRDKHIATRKNPFYLLNVSLQNGLLSFDANPAPMNTAMGKTCAPGSTALIDEVENAIREVAKKWKIGLQRLDCADSS
jgi:hypothetical protein